MVYGSKTYTSQEQPEHKYSLVLVTPKLAYPVLTMGCRAMLSISFPMEHHVMVVVLESHALILKPVKPAPGIIVISVPIVSVKNVLVIPLQIVRTAELQSLRELALVHALPDMQEELTLLENVQPVTLTVAYVQLVDLLITPTVLSVMVATQKELSLLPEFSIVLTTVPAVRA